jgi:dipeptidyl aminopeptidase/acylaminoacyl peptidase
VRRADVRRISPRHRDPFMRPLSHSPRRSSGPWHRTARTALACAALLAGGTSLASQTPAAASARASAAPPAPRFTLDDALNIVSYAAGDLSPDGRWLAATSSVRRDGFGVDFRRDGDPTYIRPSPALVWVIETGTGSARQLFPDKRNVRALTWSPDGARLAYFVLRGEGFEPAIWERATGKTTMVPVPAGKYVAENSELRWTPSGSALAFSLHSLEWRKRVREQFDRATRGPVFVQSSEEPFLAWDDLRRQGSIRSVVAYDLATAKVRELIPETMIGTFTLVAGDSAVAYTEDVTKKTDYDVIFGREEKLVVRSGSAAPRALLASTKGSNVVWAQDGTRWAYAKDGKVFASALADATPRQVAGPTGTDTARADTSKAARDRRALERFSVLRFSPAGDMLLLSNKQGLWVADVRAGTKELAVEIPDSTTGGPRMSAIGWSEDGRYIYVSTASRTQWERGVARYDRSAKRLEQLVRDGRAYNGLRLSKDGRVAVLAVAEGNRPADLYAADGALAGMKRLTDANPWLRERELGKTGLLSYLDADGHQKYGVVYYPAGYSEGTRYPTVFNIYEDFFDDSFDATANVLAANGYVVVKPSVDFDIGYPGEAWVKGVTSAANKLIEMGVTDSSRLGVHGTSYGGYATNLLITQTNRFKAAINISGKVDVISFYTDSPRLGVRNVHAAEKSQDRLGATLWEQPQKYVAHSAIMYADRIQTPLLLLTGAQDSNVPADNTREMYYALRRLGKTVAWANYMYGGHGAGNATVEDFLDFNRRIIAWYDRYLKRDKKTDVADGRSR